VAVHDLPHSVFRPEDSRHAQRTRGHLLLTANPGFETLEFDEVREVRRDVGGERVEAGGSTVPIVRRGLLHGFCDQLPADRDGPEGVSEADVFMMGVQPLSWLRVASKELAQRPVIFEHEVRQVWSGHPSTFLSSRGARAIELGHGAYEALRH
jgi:hypothetical protein